MVLALIAALLTAVVGVFVPSPKADHFSMAFDEHDLPGQSLLHWEGSQAIRTGGKPFEIRIP